MKQLQAAAELQHVAELASNHFLRIIFIERDTSIELKIHRGIHLVIINTVCFFNESC